MDFDKLVLDKVEISAIRKMYKLGSIMLDEDIFEPLRKLGLAEHIYTGSDEYGDAIYSESCSLTDKGRRYLIYKKSIFKTKRNEWIRYIITTLIALAALVLSMISLYIQYVKQSP